MTIKLLFFQRFENEVGEKDIVFLQFLCFLEIVQATLRHALGFTSFAWLSEVYTVAHREHNHCSSQKSRIHVTSLYDSLQNNFLRWGTSPTCVTCALCPQTRRKHLLRRTTWVSSRPRRWTPRTWRQPFTIFLQVTIIFHLTSTAFPFLSLPMTDNRITSLLWVITNQNNQVCCNFTHMSEIHRIVSQKSALSPGEEDVIRPANLETINVKPTVNAEAVRRQCCSS